MARKWFVEPETVRYDLGDGDWIEFKKDITYGEQQKLKKAALSLSREDTEGVLDINWDMVDIVDLVMWTVDWSLCDGDGNPMPITTETVSALSRDGAQRLQDELRKHKEAQEKNAQLTTGSTEPETK